jgi:AcrR family transcriptional regulator
MKSLLEESLKKYPAEWEILLAMNALAQDTPFERLRVQDICKNAGISKPTFYNYFHNKSDAVRWHIRQAGLAGMYQIGRKYSWREGILRTLLSVLEVRDLYAGFVFDDKSNPFQGHTFTGELFYRFALHTLAEVKRVQFTEELEFQLRTTTDIFNGCFERFRKSGLKNPETVATLCEGAIPNPLRDSLAG